MCKFQIKIKNKTNYIINSNEGGYHEFHANSGA